jgi:hypothetical protein
LLLGLGAAKTVIDVTQANKAAKATDKAAAQAAAAAKATADAADQAYNKANQKKPNVQGIQVYLR